jgi:hypothetical protein
MTATLTCTEFLASKQRRTVDSGRTVNRKDIHPSLFREAAAGVGSEGYTAVKQRRRFVGIELKPAYWRVACRNLTRAVNERNAGTLFAGEGVT